MTIVGDQTSALVGFTRGRGVRLRSRGRGIAPCKTTIVEALAQKDDIGDRVIDSENDL